ncbi:Uncharacterised protein [Chlamydia abortus]|nr:Uncharacterised protein [Chlamydia abortus]
MTVAPKGKTKPETSEETPRFLDTQRIVTGSVAELLEVDIAQDMASIMAERNLEKDILQPMRMIPPKTSTA